MSRGAYAFEKVGKGWTAERSNPDTRPALTRPAARISTASVWRSNPGKFDSFTITSEVLDPLSEPCSGPTQSTPQLVLYLMEDVTSLQVQERREILMTTYQLVERVSTTWEQVAWGFIYQAISSTCVRTMHRFPRPAHGVKRGGQ